MRTFKLSLVALVLLVELAHAQLGVGINHNTTISGTGSVASPYGVNTSLIQGRVTGSCGVGNAIAAIAADGSVTCRAAGGISNSAGVNVLMKSDGTNAVPSKWTDTGTTSTYLGIVSVNTMNVIGQGADISTFYAPSTDGNNIWIGGGGVSAAYDGSHSYSGSTNTALGHGALLANTIGNGNTAVGTSALTANTTGVFNTALGIDVLIGNTTGVVNTGVGDNALQANTSGNYNVGVGANALFSNTTGLNNVSVGHDSLSGNTTGNYNSSFGDSSMIAHTSGDYNTAVGAYALRYDQTGLYNTALGAVALFQNTTGAYNTIVGYQGTSNSTGASGITAVGANTLTNFNTTGFVNNTVVGYSTGLGLTTGTNDTIIGANVTGLAAALSNNVILADGAGTIRFQSDASGNTNVGATGTFSVNTNKFTVASATGNTAVAGLATLTGGFTIGADSSANSHKITSLTNGSAASDAAAFGQIATAVNAAVSGTTNTVAKFTGVNTVGNGWALDDATTWGVSGKFTITEASGNTGIGAAAGSGQRLNISTSTIGMDVLRATNTSTANATSDLKLGKFDATTMTFDLATSKVLYGVWADTRAPNVAGCGAPCTSQLGSMTNVSVYGNASGGNRNFSGFFNNGMLYAQGTLQLGQNPASGIGLATTDDGDEDIIVQPLLSAYAGSYTAITTQPALTMDATAANRTNIGLNPNAIATRSGGANNVINKALLATASGGQVNIAAETTDGANYLNTTSGNTCIGIASGGTCAAKLTVTGNETISTTLGVTGLSTLTGGFTAGAASSITAGTPGLNISNATQLTERIRLSGQEFYQAANTDTNGLVIALGQNRTGNRALWLMDSAALTQNSTNVAMQIQMGSTSGANIDVFSTDGGTVKALNLQPTGGATAFGVGAVTMGGTLGVTGTSTLATANATTLTSSLDSTLGNDNTDTAKLWGHRTSGGTAPTVASCGTSPSTVTGNDQAGFYTTGTTATTCTMTFSRTWTTEPSCILATAANATQPTYTVSATAITVTVDIASTKYHYICVGF